MNECEGFPLLEMEHELDSTWSFPINLQEYLEKKLQAAIENAA